MPARSFPSRRRPCFLPEYITSRVSIGEALEYALAASWPPVTIAAAVVEFGAGLADDEIERTWGDAVAQHERALAVKRQLIAWLRRGAP